MKIIEGMKEIKRLQEKLADLRGKVAKHAADLDFETPGYPDQAAKIKEWVQSHLDTVQRIADLRLAIQRTNLATNVTIELDAKQITKTIAEWVHWRRDLAKANLDLFANLQDRNSQGQTLKDGQFQQTSGQITSVKIRRYYDPSERDKNMALYKSEPSIIDGQMEITNAVTDLIGI
jgi:hypothetical protein